VNPWTKTDEAGMDDLQSLKNLDLSCNQLAAVPVRLLSMLGALEELNLGANGITVIPTGAFSGSPRLQRLNLSPLEALDYDPVDHQAWPPTTAMPTCHRFGKQPPPPPAVDRLLIESGAFNGLTGLIQLGVHDSKREMVSLRQLVVESGAFRDAQLLATLAFPPSQVHL
jgi:Leucine-rich repeat (LRR) protein